MGKHKLHHVGIVVPNADRVDALLALLGLQRGHTQYVPEYKAECVFTSCDGSALEFVIPKGGKLAEFNRGIGGLHHIAIEVDDLEGLGDQLRESDVPLLEPKAVEAGRLRINFLAPVYTGGIIVEFVQTQKDKSQ